LIDWKLKFTMKPCEEKHYWKDITVAGGPEERYRHISVVIGNR